MLKNVRSVTKKCDTFKNHVCLNHPFVTSERYTHLSVVKMNDKDV